MSIGKLFLPERLHKHLKVDGPKTKGLLKFIYGKEHLIFQCENSVSKASGKLKNNVIQIPLFSCWCNDLDALMGRVREEKVMLIWVMGGVVNSFNPIFKGEFKNKNGGSILEGYYSIHWILKIFITIWFLFCGFVPIFLTFTIIQDKGVNALSTEDFVAIAFFAVAAGIFGACGLGFASFGKRIAIESLNRFSEEVNRILK